MAPVRRQRPGSCNQGRDAAAGYPAEEAEGPREVQVDQLPHSLLDEHVPYLRRRIPQPLAVYPDVDEPPPVPARHQPVSDAHEAAGAWEQELVRVADDQAHRLRHSPDRHHGRDHGRAVAHVAKHALGGGVEGRRHGRLGPACELRVG